jgi:cyclophilin family peptidyl-prolyl cis-trans isomerase
MPFNVPTISMFLHLLKQFFTLLALSVIFFQSAGAVKIVRLELEYGSDEAVASGGYDIPKTNKTLDLELYDTEAPITVANFLNYVHSGRYDLSFINRSVFDFVLQTGGVNISIIPNTDPVEILFGEVEESPAILNEPGLPNIRGTIAMAKIEGQQHSATSEWFVNLSDNSDLLDAKNGGFTVFGSIIDDGMDAVDQIATFPVIDLSFLLGSSYSSLPAADLGDFSTEKTSKSNLVLILKAFEITRPILRFEPAIADFGTDVSGNTSGKIIDVVLENSGSEALDIGVIRADLIKAPFSVVSDSCSNTALAPVSATSAASSCMLSLQFLSTENGIFEDSLVIDYSDQANDNTYSVTYNLLGKGSATGFPEITTVNTLDVGTSQVTGGGAAKQNILVKNIGQAPLQIIEISGLSASDFVETNDCFGDTVTIPPEGSCTISVTFKAIILGKQIATLSIESNDPINTIVDIELSGFGDSDLDGVAFDIENAAPNFGDGNFDGTIDRKQNNVASFISQTGEYISLQVEQVHMLANISVAIVDQNDNLPEGVLFKHGLIEYDVIVDSPGSIVEIGLYLPSGDEPTAYYLFGEMGGDSVEKNWYQYPVTQIFSNIMISSSVKNLIKLTAQDGGIGDADNTVNGRIHIGPSIISYSPSEDGGKGGYVNAIYIAFLFTSVLLLRRCNSFCLSSTKLPFT